MWETAFTLFLSEITNIYYSRVSNSPLISFASLFMHMDFSFKSVSNDLRYNYFFLYLWPLGVSIHLPQLPKMDFPLPPSFHKKPSLSLLRFPEQLLSAAIFAFLIVGKWVLDSLLHPYHLFCTCSPSLNSSSKSQLLNKEFKEAYRIRNN